MATVDINIDALQSEINLMIENVSAGNIALSDVFDAAFTRMTELENKIISLNSELESTQQKQAEIDTDKILDEVAAIADAVRENSQEIGQEITEPPEQPDETEATEETEVAEETEDEEETEETEDNNKFWSV